MLLFVNMRYFEISDQPAPLEIDGLRLNFGPGILTMYANFLERMLWVVIHCECFCH